MCRYTTLPATHNGSVSVSLPHWLWSGSVLINIISEVVSMLPANFYSLLFNWVITISTVLTHFVVLSLLLA